MKKILVIITLLASVATWAQENYKYVIVPAKFDFLKEADKYGLNTLTKSFFETQGFTVFYDTDKLPIEIANNRCGVLYATPIDQSKLFLTNILFEIKDCQGNVLLESFRGSSREKSYEAAYKESFRAALVSMKGQLNFKNNFGDTNKEVSVPKSKEVVVATERVNDAEIDRKNKVGIDPNELHAVATETGYNLLNFNNAVVIVLYTTSVDNIYIARGTGYKEGVLLKKNTGWVFEYYIENQFFSEKVNVKF